MKICGHRGARFEAPENTLAGFAWANTRDVSAVEFDIRLSRDDQLVVIHDATVDRTTNATGPVSSFTAAELGDLDARAQFPDWPERVGVPRFTEALDVIDDRLELMIEIKPDEPAREERIIRGVLDELRRRGRIGMATLLSFDPVALEIIARLAPDQRRCLTGDWGSPEWVDRAVDLGCTVAGMHMTTTSGEMVAAAKAAGLFVVGWPVNTLADLERAISWGMDQVDTDAPSTIQPSALTTGS